MDSHTREILEFDFILSELGEYCFSEQGVEVLKEQEIQRTSEGIADWLSITTGFRSLLESGESMPTLDLPNLSSMTPRLRVKGAVLEGTELSCIGRYIFSTRDLVRFVKKNDEIGIVRRMTDVIPDLSVVARGIFRFVDREGELKDDTIPELKVIKERQKQLRREVDWLVVSYMSNPDYRSFWQSDQPTQRDGRICLPLKTNHKGRVKGIVHEVSSSGSTIYLEPFDVVETNNSLIQEQNAYRREALKILRDLTSQVAESLDSLCTMVQQVSFLDSFHARARYAILHNCTPAVFSKDRITLLDARHPLIKRKVIPIDLDLGENVRTLIITGPNTGGKTVTLKTVGILSLMNQYGMEIPVSEGSCLPVFDDCYADVGDEQSLQQSLSTFSAHIVNLTRIIRSSSRRSLVLLDELGAGTDPEEGVAIAMALLDHFIDKGAFCLTTTHHGILKNYGYTREGVQNACMEFDTTSLEPTFRILMGIPGSSHALDIAEGVGVPRELIDKAKSYLDDERGDVAELIRKLSEKQRELLAAERTQRQKNSELNEQRRETDLKELRLRQRERELRQNGLRELTGFIDESRKELNGLIKELREGDLTKEKTQKVDQYLKNIRNRIEEENQRLEQQREAEIPDFAVQVGMSVRVRGSGKMGRVLRKGKGKRWIVETDVLKVSLLPGEFFPFEGEVRDRDVEIVGTTKLGGVPAVTLDVRGLRETEVLEKLEKQIDDAVLRGLKEFSVIHGKGGGILQRAVHNYLGSSQMVDEYFFSRPEEGGYGKTNVRLRGT
jgi:DNA mismatch repair protein MutS2